VLLCGRSDLLAKPGGDTRQIISLQRHIGAKLSLELHPRLSDVDVVHVFNLSRPMEPAVQVAHARRHGKRVICTTIFQNLREYNRRGRHGAGQHLFRLLGGRDHWLETTRAVTNLLASGRGGVQHGGPTLVRALLSHRGRAASVLQAGILENSDWVVFNSSLEEETVQSCFQTEFRRRTIVPVGIDPEELEAAQPEHFLRRYRVAPGFVLSVGRLEDLKNQLGLIRALADLPLPLVLIGPENPRHRAYARSVARAAAARPRTLVIRRITRPMLLSAMAAAAVHALPSWFETAGLASMEAGAVGCAVVSTDRGYGRAVLGDEAFYCDPSRHASIRRAVVGALERGPSERLRDRLLTHFTEQNAAKAMGEIYRRVSAEDSGS
jgi:glycosyltransferase involved in cell wall biosynthesis